MGKIHNQVIEIISYEMGIDNDQINLSDSLEALGADSIDFEEILLDIEAEFDLIIPSDDWINLRTIQDIIDYVSWRTSSSTTPTL